MKDKIASNEKLLYTVKEVSELLHTNQAYVYSLIKAGLLPVLKLGSYKVRKNTLDEFLQKFEGLDLTDPKNPKSNVTDTSEKVG